MYVVDIVVVEGRSVTTRGGRMQKWQRKGEEGESGFGLSSRSVRQRSVTLALILSLWLISMLSLLH